jgi:hypothetical protein
LDATKGFMPEGFKNAESALQGEIDENGGNK